ncbi:MAG: arginyltransferase [Rhizobiales bacterium]|nr:arginyltransferase [Hyphomicrobiales bacterium]
MSVERRNFPQFFITSPAPCPYLSGRVERKVFTHLINQDAQKLHDALSHGGFRRSQNIAYRPACDGCNACVSVRVPVGMFEWTRSFRRTLRRNRDLVGCEVDPRATSEQYSLFRNYIETRHDDGGMADMTVLDFSSMINETFVNTKLIEYRLPHDISLAGRTVRGGELIAASLVDKLEDGLSMIYSFYEPELQDRGLGTFMILDHIERAQKLGLSYVYLGYWIADSQKMDYKSRFLPQERLSPDGWKLHTK